MNASILGLCLLMASGQSSGAPPSPRILSATGSTKAEQELIGLSKEKWRWMSERKVDSLADLFHEEAVFVHMGGTMSKSQELDVIRSGRIQYKNVDIQDVSVRLIGTTAILLEQDSTGRRGRRQRGHQSFRGDGGVRAAGRDLEAGLALVHQATDALTTRLDCIRSERREKALMRTKACPSHSLSQHRLPSRDPPTAPRPRCRPGRRRFVPPPESCAA